MRAWILAVHRLNIGVPGGRLHRNDVISVLVGTHIRVLCLLVYRPFLLWWSLNILLTTLIIGIHVNIAIILLTIIIELHIPSIANIQILVIVLAPILIIAGGTLMIARQSPISLLILLVWQWRLVTRF